MKRNFVVIILLFVGIKSFAQDSKISLELSYPFPIDNNFIGQSFDGIIDLGAHYRFTELKPFKVGASVNGSVLINDIGSGLKTTSYIIQPRLFGELNIASLNKIHPSLGIGYSIMILDFSGSSASNIQSSNDTETGINLNTGIAYDITKKLLIKLQYDFIKFSKPDEALDTSFNTNVNLLKLGLGYRL